MPSPTTAPPGLDPSLTVNEILRRWPAAVGPLNAFGVDCCCGGGATLRDAADAAGVPLEELVDALTLHAVTLDAVTAARRA